MPFPLIRPRLRAAAAAAALAGVLCAPGAVLAQGSAPAVCTVRSQSEAVVVMTCEPRSDQALWRTAAAKACGQRLYCNVWIWDDVSKAPRKAPASDADLPKHVAAQAAAIWAHDTESFVSLRRVPGK